MPPLNTITPMTLSPFAVGAARPYQLPGQVREALTTMVTNPSFQDVRNQMTAADRTIQYQTQADRDAARRADAAEEMRLRLLGNELNWKRQREREAELRPIEQQRWETEQRLKALGLMSNIEQAKELRDMNERRYADTLAFRREELMLPRAEADAAGGYFDPKKYEGVLGPDILAGLSSLNERQREALARQYQQDLELANWMNTVETKRIEEMPMLQQKGFQSVLGSEQQVGTPLWNYAQAIKSGRLRRQDEKWVPMEQPSWMQQGTRSASPGAQTPGPQNPLEAFSDTATTPLPKTPYVPALRGQDYPSAPTPVSSQATTPSRSVLPPSETSQMPVITQEQLREAKARMDAIIAANPLASPNWRNVDEYRPGIPFEEYATGVGSQSKAVSDAINEYTKLFNQYREQTRNYSSELRMAVRKRADKLNSLGMDKETAIQQALKEFNLL